MPSFDALRRLLRRMPLRWKDYLKLTAALLLHPRVTWRWIQFLDTDPVLRHIDDVRLLSKVSRPYLDARLTPAVRLRLLTVHYTWIRAQGLTELCVDAHQRAQTLCRWSARDEQSFALLLSSIHEGHREGELSLMLQRDGRTLYSLTGLITIEASGLPVFLVGRLQGAAAADAREQIRLATKELHGGRPAAVLVSAAAAWARALGCQALDLVDNEHRIALNPWRRRRILADNEQLWEELGAQRTLKGRWRLPVCPPSPLDLESVPSKKRAQARRRLEMLCAIDAELQQARAASAKAVAAPMEMAG